MSRPVFFDPTGSRKRWTLRTVFALIGGVLLAAIVFAATIVNVPPAQDLPVRWENAKPAALRSLSARGEPRRQRWLPGVASKKPGAPLTVGFYVPWDQASADSLRRNIGDLDWVVPAFVTVTGGNHLMQVQDDPRFASIVAGARRPPRVLPMVQNISDEAWDSAGAARLMASPAARAKLARDLAAMVKARNLTGLVMDFESLPPESLPGYIQLLDQINKAMPKDKLLAVTVPAGDPNWDYKRIAAVTDRVMLMNYDEHWQGGTAGPIASQPWFVEELRRAVSQIGTDKLIVALASYAYDYHGDGTDAMSIEEAWSAARDSDAKVTFDKTSGNSAFAYDENGKHHEVWMVDATATWNQLQAVRAAGVGSVALWRLGTEDAGVWTALLAYRHGGKPDLTRIVPATNVDVEGPGEILRVTKTPTVGERAISFDASNMIRDVQYPVLPTPYVVMRTGAADKAIALTFDDGPDPDYTPRILDILKAEHVPATFFIIGENGLQHPLLLRRLVAEGHELGNHTYTHPNLATTSAASTALELNATQRLVQAYTGRGMRLFRAPYFGDAEPTTPDELDPAVVAQKQGYTVVGLHVDPDDWKRPGVDAIVQGVLDDIATAAPDKSTNIVLLHDGGGNREQTIQALPRIIHELRARGYTFVPVSKLAGLSYDAVMPPIRGSDLLAVRADVAIFVALALIASGLRWMFFVAITLGIARAVILAALALRQRRRERGAPPVYTPTVSVIIPAYNEERVIEASVRRVLASDYPAIELIVADDGSKDRTSEIVAAAFGADPRVTLLTLVNGGKAAALNRALGEAKGEVIIALDADTQFEPETIGRLARWFADPQLGAVAGSAQVGNRVNLVTRWQAVEYITAQNLERRALAGFNAITVVPGAVGAWRRAALDAVGGYPEDTLAEDQDLTIAIQRAGWRVTYDPDAVAWTEAPESFRSLAKQRYRWAFGTLQCLWKHRGLYRDKKARGLAWIGLPQAWIFQIIFAAISPLIDLALVSATIATGVRIAQHGWEQTRGDVISMAIYWVAFTAIDVGCGWIAYRLNSRPIRYPALLLVAQRFVYRQLMYWVVLRAISSALGGWFVGWGKLERTGRVGGGEAAAAE
ncbi:glycosyltransferase [uncultured Sphingomonas sp.]|uniref:glycosyltransferase n=1 Tax=uncultured Sphingomonas sp. TaxID=158754 RepID=UPI0025E145EB|nr:glycosyltransferase [uncultured Sphingomonas sp.]